MLMIIRDGASNLFRYCEEEKHWFRRFLVEKGRDAHVRRLNQDYDQSVRK
jgi:hypothetical protein